MILGGSIYGVSVLAGGQSFPTPSTYSRVTIHGSSIADKVWVRNFELTEAQMMEGDPTETPIWDGTTLLLANFNNNIGGGSVESITDPITEFDVNRRQVDETTFTRLATVDETVSSYIDVTAEPNTTYIYEILAKNATEISEPILADPFESNFYNWVLIDEETGTAYIFNLNLQSNAFNNEINYERYDGYDKFSPFTFGDRDFVTGSITAVVQTNSSICDVQIDQPVSFLNELRAFINNKKEKILKSRKGHVLRVVTTDYSSNPLNDGIGEQPYYVSFNFTEVGEVHGS